MRRLLPLLMIFIAANAMASPQGQDPLEIQSGALRLEINRTGLALMAKEIGQALPRATEHLHLDSQTLDLPGEADIRLHDVKVGFRFVDLSLAPLNQALRLKASVADLSISIGGLEFRRKATSVNAFTDCRDTTFHLGENKPVDFAMDLELKVHDKAIELEPLEQQLNVSRGNYRVDGPALCHGFAGNITRRILHLVLGAVRPLLDPLMSRTLRHTLPLLAQELTKVLDLELQLELARLDILPPRRVTLRAFPAGAMVNEDQGLILEAGMQLTGEDLDPKPKRAHLQDDEDTSIFTGPRLGSLGVNPAIVTHAYRALVAGESPWLEIDQKLLPNIEDVLKVSYAASIWPELKTLPISASHLKVFARLNQAPVVIAQQNPAMASLAISDIDLALYVEVDGKWQRFFDLNLDFSSGLAPSLTFGNIVVHLKRDSKIVLRGAWADGFTPKDPTFNHEFAQVAFSATLDYIATKGPLLSLKAEAFKIGGARIGVEDFRVEDAYLTMGLRSDSASAPDPQP